MKKNDQIVVRMDGDKMNELKSAHIKYCTDKQVVVSFSEFIRVVLESWLAGSQ